MKIISVCAIALLSLQPLLAQAAIGYRTALVDAAQTDSSTRVGYESLMYIAQSGVWTGSPSCPAQWAYFNAKENPHFVAMVLAARLGDKSLQVYVDDSLLKVSGFCQIIDITL